MNGELIRRARQTDLVEWLRRNGEELIRAGQWWYVKGNDSLRIQGNKWYRNSQGTSGNAIDFLVVYYGLSKKDAIEQLLQGNPLPTLKRCGVKKSNMYPNFRIESIARANDNHKVAAYLSMTRCIPADVVAAEMKKGMLFQEAPYGNAVFAMTDEYNNFTGAEVVGTLVHVRFKGIKSGSVAGYGYSLGQKDDPQFILFFESAIDLLSFVAISLRRKKPLTNCLLLSMAGLKPGIVSNLLRIFKDATPVLCVDNDAAGHDFISRICTIYPGAIIKQPDVQFKDWNDQLCSSHFSIDKNS